MPLSRRQTSPGSQHLVEPEVSQHPLTGHCPEPAESSPHPFMHCTIYLRTLVVTQMLEGMWKEPARIAISDTIGGIGVEAVTEPTRQASLLLWTCV
jgi:hypothetical protein